MSKIATSYDINGGDWVLRRDIYKIKQAINQMKNVASGYTTFSNLTTDRTCDADATTVAELADILGTLIEDLKSAGIISA